MDLKLIPIKKPDEVNVIFGQAHFIKTVEDLYETIVAASPAMKFGLAFSEASGACKVRLEGNDDEMKKLAGENVLKIGAGHCFLIMIREGFPINVLNSIKNVAEVCSIFAATANPVEVVLAEGKNGRGVIGVIDGAAPKGIEDDQDIAWRKDLLRKIGYKR